MLLIYLAFKRIKFSGGYITVQAYNDYFEGIIKIARVTSTDFNAKDKFLYSLLKYNSVRRNFDDPNERLTFDSYEKLIIALYNTKSYISQVYELKKDKGDTNPFKLDNLEKLYKSLIKGQERDRSCERYESTEQKPIKLDDRAVPQNVVNAITQLKTVHKSTNLNQVDTTDLIRFNRTNLEDYDVIIVDNKYIFSAYNSVFHFMPSTKTYKPAEFNIELKNFGPPNINKNNDNSITIPPNAFYNTIRFESNGQVLVDDSSFVGVTCYPMDKNTVETNFDMNKLDTTNVLYSVTSDLHGSFLSLVCWMIQSQRISYDKEGSQNIQGYRFTPNDNGVKLICLGDIVGYKNAIESPIDGITYNVKLMFDLINLVFIDNYDCFVRGNHEMMLFHQYKNRFNVTKLYDDELRRFIFNLIDVQDKKDSIIPKQQTIDDIKDYICNNIVNHIQVNKNIEKLYDTQNYPTVVNTPYLLTQNEYKKYCIRLQNRESNKFVYSYGTITKDEEKEPLYLFTHQSLVNMIVDNINTLADIIPFTYFGWYDYDKPNQTPHIRIIKLNNLKDKIRSNIGNIDDYNEIYGVSLNKNNTRDSYNKILSKFEYNDVDTNHPTDLKLLEYYSGYCLRALYHTYGGYITEANSTFFCLDVFQLLKLYTIPTELFNTNISNTVRNIIKTRTNIADWFDGARWAGNNYTLLCKLNNFTNDLDSSLTHKIINIHGHIGSLLSFVKSSNNSSYIGQTFDAAYNSNYIDEDNKISFNRNLFNNKWSTFNDCSVDPKEYRNIQTNFLDNTNQKHYLPLSIDSSFVFRSDDNILATYYGYTTKLHSIYPILTIDTDYNIYDFNIFKCFNKTNDFGERKMLLLQWLNILGRTSKMQNKIKYNIIFNLIRDYHYAENNKVMMQTSYTTIRQQLEEYQNTIRCSDIVLIEIGKIKGVLNSITLNHNDTNLNQNNKTNPETTTDASNVMDVEIETTTDATNTQQQ